MNIEQAKRDLVRKLEHMEMIDPSTIGGGHYEALSTLYHLAVERDEALRQAEEAHDKLEALREALKGLRQ